MFQAKSNRPNTDVNNKNEYLEEKEFKDYIRRGSFRAKSLTAGDAPGEYLLPETVRERISLDLKSSGSIRSLARSMQISTGAVDVILDRNDPEVGRVGETDHREETKDPELLKHKITAHEMYARPKATQKLLDDAAVNIEEWLVKRVANHMSKEENKAFLFGDGDNKPHGILSYPTVEGNDWEWGSFEHISTGINGEFGEDGAEILIETLNALKTEYREKAVWVMSRSAHAAVRKLKDPGTGQYLWQPALGGEKSPTILGYPVIITDDMPALVSGTAGKSILFGDFESTYMIIDRLGMSVLRDPYSSKPYVEFYVSKRVGGDVINFESMKVINFTAGARVGAGGSVDEEEEDDDDDKS
jgi:HK97 family phage major capsid protein